MMRRTLILLISAISLSTEALSLSVDASAQLDACATVDCPSDTVCALAVPPSCNVAPCPKMPTCLPKNMTCDAKSCKADETCVLKTVMCIMAPCYPIRQCKKYPKCGANEEYNECSLNGPCEPNCKESFPICANVTCGSGACECKPGYFRHNGTCITKDKCPTPTCNKNETWNTCPSACTRTCRILRGKDEQMMCPAVCGAPQCTCEVGYVRDDDNNCVKEADCPKEFKCNSPHEEYKECSSQCEPSCNNRNPACVDSCGPAKCQCKPNYVRDNGQCIFALQCPQEGNATIVPLYPHGDDSGSQESGEDSGVNITCANLRCAGQCTDTPNGPKCGGQSAPSCATVKCAENTVCQLKNGQPICQKCGKNERIETCPNPCSESSCGEPEGKVCNTLIKMCRPQSCVCADGFVRNMRNGQCVTKSKCPAGNSTLIDPIPLIGTRPFLNRTIDTNGTVQIMPFPIQISPPRPNGTMHILPYFPKTFDDSVSVAEPKNGTKLVRPALPDNGAVHIMPIAVGGNELLVDPIFRNGTVSTKPFFPANGTKPLVMPLIDPIPYVPSNGTFHTMPIAVDEPHIMPFPETNNGTRPRPQVMPLIDPIPQIMPFPETNNGTRPRPQIMPLIDPIPQIMPFPETINGTKPRPQVMPLIDPIPYIPSNGTMHIMPVPAVMNGTKPLVMPLENGTVHTLPFIPSNATDNGAVHILPVPTMSCANLRCAGPCTDTPNGPKCGTRPTNASDVCANHTCPAGSWCEETPVMCIRAPCPPIPTCVSVKPGKDDSAQCGKNEEHATCAPSCQETCRGVKDCIETLMCKPGCVCKKNFKRDGNGVCVPNSKCWKSAGCHENEVWHKCKPCEPTCTDANEICTFNCVSGCGCDDGYVRGPDGECIEEEECPATTTTKMTTTSRPSSSSPTSASKSTTTTSRPSNSSTTSTPKLSVTTTTATKA